MRQYRVSLTSQDQIGKPRYDAIRLHHTLMRSARPAWDNVIALSYAAEQLFMAAQLLTSDTVPLHYAVTQTCDRHLRSLLQFANLLPDSVNRLIRDCLRDCNGVNKDSGPGSEEVRLLAAKINQVLDEVRRLISNVSGSDIDEAA